MISFLQFLSESTVLTNNEFREVKNKINQLFSILNIDVIFTNHFLERLNDERNVKPITRQELIDLFRKERDKNGNELLNMDLSHQAVLRDINSNINIPFVLEWDKKKKKLELVAKSVMRKKNFMTTSLVFSV